MADLFTWKIVGALWLLLQAIVGGIWFLDKKASHAAYAVVTAIIIAAYLVAVFWFIP